MLASGRRTGLALAAAVVAAAVAVVLVLGLIADKSFSYDDPFDRLPNPAGQGNGTSVPSAPDPQTDLAGFLTFVDTDVQRFWAGVFKQSGRAYAPARLAVFDQVARSGCGPASAATGPFYCALDQTVYLDAGFFRQLAVEFHAPGDFADAYVIAHELGHHVQNLTGITAQVNLAISERQAPPNELSIRQELQADCFAGVWGHSTYERRMLDTGDLDEALRAAAAVGDDRIQKKATGRINPETWTHGSSAQRKSWYLRGFESGDPNACDTFSAAA
jgi:predicted metalloprotease